MDAENTYQINACIWTSGQLSERDIELLPKLGIQTVINLALPTSSNALPGEAELISLLGIYYLHIPVVWECPRLEELRTFFDVIDTFKGKRIWVHCAKNMRVSAFIYLYRKLRLKETEQQALFPMTAVWTPNETWQRFIDTALVPGLWSSKVRYHLPIFLRFA